MKPVLQVAAVAVSLSFATAAQATILSFDLNPSVGNGSLLGNYGDNVSAADTDVDGTGAAAAGSYSSGSEDYTPNVSISYQGSDPKVWTTGYSDLTNVFYDETDGSAGFGFTLLAEAGYVVELYNFKLGNYGGGLILPSITAMVDGVTYWTENDYALAGSGTAAEFVFPRDASDNTPAGTEISLFIDLTGLSGSSDNVGIDDIAFGQALAPTQVSPVPLPAGLPLLLAGLGAFGLIRRKT